MTTQLPSAGCVASPRALHGTVFGEAVPRFRFVWFLAAALDACTPSPDNPVPATVLPAPPHAVPPSSSSPPAAVSSPAGPASSTPKPPSPPTSRLDRAKELVQGTKEYAWLAKNCHIGIDVQPSEVCAEPSCDIRVDIILEVDPYYRFRVRADGSIVVDEKGGSLVAYDTWSAREQQTLAELEATIQRLTEKLVKLPEFAAFAKRSRSQGGNAVVWLETPPAPGCTAANPSCIFQFYAGEILTDHASRWATFRIAKHGEGISVVSIDSIEPVPYAAWRRQKH